MKFGHEILKYRDDILRDLAKLIAVPSVCTHPLPGKPFGEAPAQALECILSMAKNMGFETENTDNYAGAVYYGTGTEYVDVLTHVDVVPAGDGWNTDPFQMVIKDGMAYGRGVSDDKGAAIVALYCLKALKDAGIQGKYVLRTVFGSGEEIASDDLDRFYTKHPYPVMGFTPDCGYGICQCEKESSA
ncbi:MAG: Sapep family Mn(2+)-dependent dipeptidase [Lachnospiraceae bacterium]